MFPLAHNVTGAQATTVLLVGLPYSWIHSLAWSLALATNTPPGTSAIAAAPNVLLAQGHLIRTASHATVLNF